MKLSLFLAKRVAMKGKKTFSKLIVNIAIAGIALGLTVMILALAIVTGFKNEIRGKVIGFSGHIQIVNYNLDNSYDPAPITPSLGAEKVLSNHPKVDYFQVFGTKAGIVSTSKDMEGLILKGVGADYHWSFIQEKLLKGKVPTYTDTAVSNEVLISKSIANRLALDTGDKIVMYFIQEPVRARNFKIVGVYETGIEELDKIFIVGDIGHIRRLNDWSEGQVKGYEVFLTDFESTVPVSEELYEELDTDLYPQPITDIYSQIFDWLNLTDVNAQVILILMLLVAAINMISALLIIILEKTRSIGVLKALGASTWTIQKVFLYHAGFLISRGLFWGNLIAISLLLLQHYVGVVALPVESYYVSKVPVEIDVFTIVGLNIGTLILCLLMMIIPSFLVSKISPIKAIRFN
jgi:lipoprotein-releasing system permease protein